jgi:hypothetical protein
MWTAIAATGPDRKPVAGRLPWLCADKARWAAARIDQLIGVAEHPLVFVPPELWGMSLPGIEAIEAELAEEVGL